MKMLPLLFAVYLSAAADSSYLLPHQWQDARHALNVTIKAAEETIVLVSDAFDDPYLRRMLRRALQADRQVVLMTSSTALASEWAIYENVNACLLPSSPLPFSMIVSDQKQQCTLSAPLRTKTMRTAYGLVVCKKGASDMNTVALLQQECTPYLEE